jgi:predicted oxidoreductase
MAWSPLARGRLFNPADDRDKRIYQALTEVKEELNLTCIDTVIYIWLLQHPAGIIPVSGTGRIERLQYALDALNIRMSTEQWYRIYIASTGCDLP